MGFYRRYREETQLGIYLQTDDLVQDYERLSKIFKNWYSTNLENKEHALRGWNWGKAEFGKAELTFSVQNRPAFELPYSEISNTNLAGRNEVAVEFSLPTDENDTGTNGHLGGARGRGKKAGAGKDQMVEMRFYVPGTTTKKETDGDDAGSDVAEEEKNAATQFYETLIDKAEIGETAGDTIATFLDVLHLTPRGRFDIDMYEASFRLRGKTYDYKIQYDHIKKFMVLPKPDDVHFMLCVGLDPPLRQGQTRYPFIVMQFKKDEEVAIDLNLTEEELSGKYKDKLEPHYEKPLHQVVTFLFKGLGNKKVTMPAKDFTTYVFWTTPSLCPKQFIDPFTVTANNMASNAQSRRAKASCTASKRPSSSSPSRQRISATNRPSPLPSPASAEPCPQRRPSTLPCT
jgi:structure-specific recognition protein 1